MSTTSVVFGGYLDLHSSQAGTREFYVPYYHTRILLCLLHTVELGKKNREPPLKLLGYVDPECRPGSLVPILA